MIQNKENLHIMLGYPPSFPSKAMEPDISMFSTDGLKMKTYARPEPTMYAAMEWIIPTMFVAYIFKPYFESFLKEAGKDHYHLLKKSIKKFVDKGKDLDVKIITSAGATDKLDNGYTQSHAISLCFQSKGDRDLKLLFDVTMEQSDWNAAIDQVFDVLIDNYKNYPNDKLSEEIKDLRQDENFTIYILIDNETKRIKFYDDKKLLIESKR